MSSGTYFPPPVRAVEIPKRDGKGVRTLGVPTVADRVAQTVARLYLEPEVEPLFHPDSYGYRPGRSGLDAVAACRQRCVARISFGGGLHDEVMTALAGRLAGIAQQSTAASS
jgi:retron-type reverse transcriptase